MPPAQKGNRRAVILNLTGTIKIRNRTLEEKKKPLTRKAGQGRNWRQEEETATEKLGACARMSSMSLSRRKGGSLGSRKSLDEGYARKKKINSRGKQKGGRLGRRTSEKDREERACSEKKRLFEKEKEARGEGRTLNPLGEPVADPPCLEQRSWERLNKNHRKRSTSAAEVKGYLQKASVPDDVRHGKDDVGRKSPSKIILPSQGTRLYRESSVWEEKALIGGQGEPFSQKPDLEVSPGPGYQRRRSGLRDGRGRRDRGRRGSF